MKNVTVVTSPSLPPIEKRLNKYTATIDPATRVPREPVKGRAAKIGMTHIAAANRVVKYRERSAMMLANKGTPSSIVIPSSLGSPRELLGRISLPENL
jgi:hypothetical protein